MVIEPKIRKIKHPLLPKYKIPFPNDYFSKARMDMVLDYLLDPQMLLKVVSEIKRTIMPDSSFHIVDHSSNLEMVSEICRLLRFNSVKLTEHDTLVNSNYLLSPQSLSFISDGYKLFHLKAVK